MQKVQPEEDARRVEYCSCFVEHFVVNVHHQIAATSVLHDKAHVLRCLEARKQIDQEGVANAGGRLKNALLRQQTIDFIASNDVPLFECLDGKVLLGLLVLAQENLQVWGAKVE